MEFAAENHNVMINGREALPWLDATEEESIQLLEDAFFDTCVSVQICIIKAIYLMYVFDKFQKYCLRRFLKRVTSQAMAVHYALEKLSRLVN